MTLTLEITPEAEQALTLEAQRTGQSVSDYAEPSSRLEYHANVKLHKEFKLDGKTFNNVHVVTLKLKFSQNFAATTTEGMHFDKERTAVLDADGKVLYISGDGPTEVPILAI